MAQLEARGAKYVFIVDSIFNSSPRHVVQTCEAILQRNLSIHWGCFMRPQGLTPALVDLMARAGVRIANRTSHARLVRVFAVLIILVGLRMALSVFVWP